MLGLLEDEGEGVVELLLRAEPDELALAHVDIGAELFGEGGAGARVEPVGGDHQIVLRHQRFGVVHLGLEAQVDAQFARALLKQEQQPHAADAAEAMARGKGAHALVDDGDVVPIGEMLADGGGALRVVGGEIVEGFIGEDDAPAERVVGLVALEHDNLVSRVAQLHRDGKIQARRPAPEHCNLHRSPSTLLCFHGELHHSRHASSIKFQG